MEISHEQAKASVTKATHANETLFRITEAISTINQMNMQIASAAEQQTAAADEINNRISAICQIAVESGDSAKKTTASSVGLEHLAEDLAGLIRVFKIS